jgi:hypothetical protein
MGEFNFPVDVANRALQRVGAGFISTTLGFSENSKRASQVANCYGKLRRAELQENVWRFATRKAAIRPIDTNTLSLKPTLWSSTTTYFIGSIVVDASNSYWQSKIPNNLGNQPGQIFSAWQPYFGPLTVALYDSSVGYFADELVYTAAGDGTYNVFASLITGNSVHPALPDQWATGTTYFTNNVVQQFPAWASGTTYAKGAGALYTDGNVYVSLISGNVGNVPPSSAADWALMPTLILQSQLVPTASNPAPTPVGTTPIDEWGQQDTYSLGSFAIFNATVYVSLANSNTGNFPDAASSTWWASVTGGMLYMSLIDLNIGNSPANTPANWSSVTTYTTGQVVAATDGYNYTATSAASNLNKNPANGANPTYWTQGSLTAWSTSFTQGGGNSQWMQVGGASFPGGTGLGQLGLIWPIGTGPLSNIYTKNVYRLPANYLRRAPQDPAAGRFSFLGAPTALQMNDWEFDGDYLISSDTDVLTLRFVADMQDVSRFNDMFCEAFARRIAEEVCEPLTQSTEKLREIRNEYVYWVGRAKIANAIDMQADEQPMDDYLACRY